MESSSIARKSRKRVFSGSSSSSPDIEVIEIAPSVVDRTVNKKAKGKQKEVAYHEIIDVDLDDDCGDVVVLEGKVESNKKAKVGMGISLGSSSSAKSDLKKVASNKKGKEILVDPGHFPEGFNPGSNNFFDLDDYVFDDEYGALQSHFDYNGLPAGMEATAPWLPEIVSMKKDNSAIPYVTSNAQLEASGSQPNKVDPMPLSSSKKRTADATVNGRTSKSSRSAKSSSTKASLVDDAVKNKYESFKKFDTVVDHSDHYYTKQNLALQPAKSWAKKIQDEWKILEKDLPDTIFVRVYESRMDLLRAVIIGAEGTPYHDGLFFFDVCFPSNYPHVPPLVHYHAGGLRINPNLYNCGKVCLSLLNTWTGVQNEKWVPGKSTMLQVLVSIQGLILNMKPYFNEPGFAHSAGSVHGEKSAIQYNERTLILSLKTMVYTMRKPPKHFEDLVIGHFQHRVRDILMACKAYTEGVQVGCLVKGGVQDVDEGSNSCSPKFKHDVCSYIKTLIAAFKKIGAKEAEEFLFLSAKESSLPAAPGPAVFNPIPAPAVFNPIPAPGQAFFSPSPAPAFFSPIPAPGPVFNSIIPPGPPVFSPIPGPASASYKPTKPSYSSHGYYSPYHNNSISAANQHW